MGATLDLITAGARLHQTGCMGCIGMGQAPAAGRNSLRTMPRNFPGRSGTKEDSVYLCSPETAAAAALTGQITDPRKLPELLGIEYPQFELPTSSSVNVAMLEEPLPEDEAQQVELVKGENISTLPDFDKLDDRIEAPVALKVGDDVSTDEILPAGARVLPFRSNIPKLAEFTFGQVDESYAERVTGMKDGTGHIIVGGANYGQGSSREHAAIAPATSACAPCWPCLSRGSTGRTWRTSGCWPWSSPTPRTTGGSNRTMSSCSRASVRR